MTAPLQDQLAQLLYDTEPHRGDQARLAWAYLPEADEAASHGQAHYRRWAERLRQSEEWQAREAVVEAARVLAGIGAGQQTQGGQHLLAERSAWLELRTALARLDAARR